MQIVQRWIPTDALDLNTADATFVRAFVESTTVAFFGGGAKSAYPGFAEAMQPALAPDRYVGTPRDGYGVDYFRITEFAEIDGTRVRVIGCKDSPSGHPNTPIAQPNTPRAKGIASAFSLTYQRRTQAPPTQQRGDQRAPSNSVFGDWHALEYIADYEQNDLESVRPCIGQHHTDDPFAPSPGWPSHLPQV